MATTELKVGTLVLAAGVGLGWLSLQSGVWQRGASDSTTLHTAFSNVNGLESGHDVKRAGVTVGKVKRIELAPSGMAKVYFSVQQQYNIPQNVKTQIKADGVIGEKYLALVAGTTEADMISTDYQQALPSVGSASAGSVDELTGDFSKIAADLKEVSESLRVALGGPQGAKKLNRILNGLATFSDNVGGNQTEQLFEDISVAAASLREMLEGTQDGDNAMLGNLNKTADNLAVITERMRNGEGMLGRMMTDDDFGSSLVSDLRVAAKDLRSITNKINTGEGTIGKLVNDPSTADKLNSTLDTFSGVAQRVESFQTSVDFNAYSLAAENGASKGNFHLRLQPRPTRFYVAGIQSDGLANRAEGDDPNSPYFGQDFGGQSKFTLQFGHVLQDIINEQDFSFRIGLKNNTAGVGLDTTVPFPYWPEKKIEISGDLYDFAGDNSGDISDNPHLDLAAKMFLINNSIYSMVGYDDALNQEYASPFFGIGLRFQDDDLKYFLGSRL